MKMGRDRERRLKALVGVVVVTHNSSNEYTCSCSGRAAPRCPARRCSARPDHQALGDERDVELTVDHREVPAVELLFFVADSCDAIRQSCSGSSRHRERTAETPSRRDPSERYRESDRYRPPPGRVAPCWDVRVGDWRIAAACCRVVAEIAAGVDPAVDLDASVLQPLPNRVLAIATISGLSTEPVRLSPQGGGAAIRPLGERHGRRGSGVRPSGAALWWRVRIGRRPGLAPFEPVVVESRWKTLSPR